MLNIIILHFINYIELKALLHFYINLFFYRDKDNEKKNHCQPKDMLLI